MMKVKTAHLTDDVSVNQRSKLEAMLSLVSHLDLFSAVSSCEPVILAKKIVLEPQQAAAEQKNNKSKTFRWIKLQYMGRR
jgi:hypothetical protein